MQHRHKIATFEIANKNARSVPTGLVTDQEPGYAAAARRRRQAHFLVHNSGGTPQRAAAQIPVEQTQISQDRDELKSIIDLRLIEKLETFSGKDENWMEWYSGFEATTGLVGLEELMSVAAAPETTDKDCSLNYLAQADMLIQAKALWYVLMITTRGKARSIVKQVEKYNGAAAWRAMMLSRIYLGSQPTRRFFSNRACLLQSVPSLINPCRAARRMETHWT